MAGFAIATTSQSRGTDAQFKDGSTTNAAGNFEIDPDILGQIDTSSSPNAKAGLQPPVEVEASHTPKVEAEAVDTATKKPDATTPESARHEHDSRRLSTSNSNEEWEVVEHSPDTSPPKGPGSSLNAYKDKDRKVNKEKEKPKKIKRGRRRKLRLASGRHRFSVEGRERDRRMRLAKMGRPEPRKTKLGTWVLEVVMRRRRRRRKEK